MTYLLIPISDDKKLSQTYAKPPKPTCKEPNGNESGTNFKGLNENVDITQNLAKTLAFNQTNKFIKSN